MTTLPTGPTIETMSPSNCKNPKKTTHKLMDVLGCKLAAEI